MDRRIPVRITLKGFDGLTQAVLRDLTPLITASVDNVAKQTKKVWGERILEARGVWIKDRERYSQSLDHRMTGPFSAEVGTDELIAEQIEKGRPARDLKKMLNTSTKVRRTEQGRRFLVIPLRHNTPGSDATAPAMSDQAYQMALGLKRSLIKNHKLTRPAGQMVSSSLRTGMRPSPLHSPYLMNIKSRQEVMVPARTTAWGGRLKASQLRLAGMSNEDIRRYAGMVKVGKRGHPGYLTFRTMAEGQSGWVIRAKPGLWIARDVASTMQPVAQEIMAQAAKLDMD